MPAFHNKVAIITGASSGLGAALSIALASEGADLGLFDRNQEGLEATASRCEGLGRRVVRVGGDVTRVEDCKNLVQATVDGLGRLDYLVANAGLSMWSRFDEIEDLGVFKTLMDTNFLGVVYCVHPALPHLKAASGMIVAVSSIQGKIGVPQHTAYAASKHALEGFLASLRTELVGTGVDVLSVLPHWLRGTNLRANALGKDGRKVGEGRRDHSRESISLEECCTAIVKAMRKRKRELVIPWKLKLLPWLNLIYPAIVDRLVRGKMESQKKSDP